MLGHNTPVKALTQMTKLQKATASRTPAKPAGGAECGAAARVATGPRSCQACAATLVVAVCMAIPLKRDLLENGSGSGLGAGCPLLAQQQDLPHASHLHASTPAAAQGAVTTTPGSTWANWKASPSNKLMSVFMAMTVCMCKLRDGCGNGKAWK